MDNHQLVLAELLKLKASVIEHLNNHRLIMHPSDVLTQINRAIELFSAGKDKQ